ncbi:hypothetical protein SERLA73DRAFT_179977 [Serpula lacrymans var. lacrymans S7.3]|uniref:FAD dependent oxidoreductase domain-containing protein n=2 Tax=Serpula lacrymans var. lacrymans TaxID=341189 RepID=F8PV83_SERL3|nr:uncharacterized protein SERLADRAFT_448325 [Serpula lacrymans var. lacrymans S7.9]EGN99775.1 hypothetical protein SERLA73DRAFT_179977 [Serpula lacrymans var. lacrymans S7.3]EGO25350.1 hypothetical protein SERLADRAFT_448325 [Serpula lacrymans var. lacrymans S7.9]
MQILPILLNQSDHHQSLLSAPPTIPLCPARLPSTNPTASFWLDSAPDVNPLAREGSEGPLTTDADICIIGSGITGVGTAYHLAEAVQYLEFAGYHGPLKIVILEARDFCSGATGRNGGHLTPVAFRNFHNVAAQYGTDEAIRSVALEEHTAATLVSIIHEHNLEDEVDLVEGGNLRLLFTEKEVANAKRGLSAADQAGVSFEGIEWMDKKDVQARFGPSYPAIRIPGHNVWPLKLVTKLYQLAQARSSPNFALALHTHTPVTGISCVSAADITCQSRRYILETPRGHIACSRIVHATNGYASHLLPFLTGPKGIIPVRGQVVALRAVANAKTIGNNGWGANEGFEYWFPRPVAAATESPLVILGGGRETAESFEHYEDDDSVLDPAVGRVLRDFLPAVFQGKYRAGREPEMEWSGIMGYTKIGDPLVGPVIDLSNPGSNAYPGQYIAAGYSGHGMPRAFACGEVISQMIVSELVEKEWTSPTWLPVRYLTWNRVET